MCRHINADIRQIAEYNQFSQTAAVKILRQKDKKIKNKVKCDAVLLKTVSCMMLRNVQCNTETTHLIMHLICHALSICRTENKEMCSLKRTLITNIFVVSISCNLNHEFCIDSNINLFCLLSCAGLPYVFAEFGLLNFHSYLLMLVQFQCYIIWVVRWEEEWVLTIGDAFKKNSALPLIHSPNSNRFKLTRTSAISLFS